MQVTLSYSGASPSTMAFDVYSVHYLDVEFEKSNAKGVNMSYVENTIGYRWKTSVDFAPLNEDKTKLYWIYGFLIGTSRTVTGDFGTRNVTITGNALNFSFMDGIRYGDAFTLEMLDQTLSTVTDDGSTRTLQLSYVPFYGSTVDQFYVSLVDVSSVDLSYFGFKFVGGNRDDICTSYAHKLVIDFGLVMDTSKRTRLLEFALWKNKRIDTTAIDPVYGQVFDVVCVDNGMSWKLEDGVNEATSITMSFIERNARAIVEGTTPPVKYDEVKFDEGVFS